MSSSAATTHRPCSRASNKHDSDRHGERRGPAALVTSLARPRGNVTGVTALTGMPSFCEAGGDGDAGRVDHGEDVTPWLLQDREPEAPPITKRRFWTGSWPAGSRALWAGASS
jgi:hypothetical protein